MAFISRCRPDRSCAKWFKCALGTIGCPHIHDNKTPHCIECAAGEPCQFNHNPPALEKVVTKEQI